MPSLAMGSARPHPLADWIELELMFGSDPVLSRSEIVSYLREEAGLDELTLFDEAFGDLETWDESIGRHDLRQREAEATDASTQLTDDAMMILQDRADTIGLDYPLEPAGDGVRLREDVSVWLDTWVYAFLSLLSARLTLGIPASTVATDTPARLFERLVAHALRTYWGGQSRHLGFPRDNSTAFRDEVVRLSRDIVEPLGVKPRDIPTRFKDLGLDAAAWRTLDERRGNSVLLCQCAIGAEWDTKSVNLKEWQVLIRFAVTPLRATAFPLVPESIREFNDAEWALLCARIGIPLDRIRLTRLLQPADVPEPLRTNIIDWVEEAYTKVLH